MDLEQLIIFSTIGVSIASLILLFVVGAHEKPAELSETAGKIVPSRKMNGLACVSLASIMLVMPILGHLLISPGSGLVIVNSTLCALLYLWCWNTLDPYYDVHWDDTQITGPGGLSLRPSRAKQIQLGWDELHSLTRYSEWYYLSAKDSRTIQWTILHGGNHVFRDHIRKRRPDLMI